MMRLARDGDNRACIATDSVKNIVNVTAARNLTLDAESFVGTVARVLLETYPQVASVSIEAEETRWLRHAVDGLPHGQTFTRDGNGFGLVADRAGSTLRSGLRGFTFMKTTQCGWTGFVDDPYRTLPAIRPTGSPPPARTPPGPGRRSRPITGL